MPSRLEQMMMLKQILLQIQNNVDSMEEKVDDLTSSQQCI